MKLFSFTIVGQFIENAHFKVFRITKYFATVVAVAAVAVAVVAATAVAVVADVVEVRKFSPFSSSSSDGKNVTSSQTCVTATTEPLLLLVLVPTLSPVLGLRHSLAHIHNVPLLLIHIHTRDVPLLLIHIYTQDVPTPAHNISLVSSNSHSHDILKHTLRTHSYSSPRQSYTFIGSSRICYLLPSLSLSHIAFFSACVVTRCDAWRSTDASEAIAR